MKVSFLSLDENGDKIFFESDVQIQENEFFFMDKSCDNTQIQMKIDEKGLVMNRIGDVNMRINFQEGKKTEGTYRNQLGLEFLFFIDCHEIKVEKKRIFLDYTFILDQGNRTKHKISLLFNESLAK